MCVRVCSVVAPGSQFNVKRLFLFQAELGCLERKEICQWGCASGDAHLVGWLPGNA